MSYKTENPPAFSQPIGHNGYVTKEPTGMTLRDYFAAAALQGLCSRSDISLTDIIDAANIVAEAMLKARQS